MRRFLRILLKEQSATSDLADPAHPLMRQLWEKLEVDLQCHGVELSWERVSSAEGFVQALQNHAPDLMICGVTVGDSAQRLADIAMARRLLPKLEAVCVCGSLEQEFAGATATGNGEFTFLQWVAHEPYSRLLGVIGRTVECVAARLERQWAGARDGGTFENAAIGIVQTGPDGRLLRVNAALASLFGYDSVEQLLAAVSGKGVQLYRDPEDGIELHRVLRRDGAVQNFEVKINQRDGGERWVLLSGRAYRDEAANSLRHEVYVQDITERKDLEARCLRAQRMESIGTMASGVAHDLNNVLAPILMCAPLLRAPLSADRLENIVSTIELSAQRGADMVNQVVLFGRKAQGERRPLYLGELVEDLVGLLRTTFPKNIELQSFCAESLSAVSADSSELRQMLLNLCVNARDAMPQGGGLRLTLKSVEVDARMLAPRSTCKPGRYVCVEVSDTGEGIAPEILGKFFDPFFTTKDSGQGAGLGLAIVSSIVRSHGGFFKVESQRGLGSTFRIFLPALTGRAAHGAKPEAAAGSVPGPMLREQSQMDSGESFGGAAGTGLGGKGSLQKPYTRCGFK